MSDRKVRSLLEKAGEYIGDQGYGDRCWEVRKAKEIAEVLDEPPDLVVLLQHVEQERKMHMNTAKHLRGERLNNLAATADFAEQKAEELIHWIAFKFHIRLIPDGWEWIKEEACES